MISAATQPAAPSAKDALIEMLPALEKLWPLWLLVAGAAAVRFAGWLITERRLARSGIRQIDEMDGFTFERRLASLFRRLGYGVERTSARGDYGADLVVRRDGKQTVVQAKRWKKNVGVKAVQEAVAAKAMYGCDSAMVVTNRYFTPQAKKLARANDVRLWGRDELTKALLDATKARTRPEHRPDMPDAAPTGAPTHASLPAAAPPPDRSDGERAEATPATAERPVATANCARCGKPVSDRVRDFCLADTKRFGGLVYCFTHQRAFARRRT